MIDSIRKDLEHTGLLHNPVCAKELAKLFGVGLPERRYEITVSGVKIPVVSIGFADMSLYLGREIDSK